jgi:hypothetical protein
VLAGRAEELLSHRVDQRPVVDVEQVDGDLDDVGGPRTRGSQHLAHGREDLPRLRDDVVAADDLSGGVDGQDAGQVERVAGGHGVGVVAERLGEAVDGELAAGHDAAAERVASLVAVGIADALTSRPPGSRRSSGAG